MVENGELESRIIDQLTRESGASREDVTAVMTILGLNPLAQYLTNSDAAETAHIGLGDLRLSVRQAGLTLAQ